MLVIDTRSERVFTDLLMIYASTYPTLPSGVGDLSALTLSRKETCQQVNGTDKIHKTYSQSLLVSKIARDLCSSSSNNNSDYAIKFVFVNRVSYCSNTVSLADGVTSTLL